MTTSNGYEDASTDDVLSAIEAYQSIQKTTPPSDPEWDVADQALDVLYAEMASRTQH